MTVAVLVGSVQCSVEKTTPWSLHAKGESHAIDANTHKALTPNVVATVTAVLLTQGSHLVNYAAKVL